ncbi:MAG: glycosyltransferase family 87 protein, partial [Bacteroidetes bacterium]|nr:glycosyltransferase family 87 protein [Bacteroidota bacterium]
REIIREYLFEKSNNNENLLLSLACICVAIHFVKEFHLGNINTVLLFLLCLSLYSLLKSRNILAGVLFALVVLTKPFFLILLLPLIFRKKWKALASLAGTLILSFLIPALFFGFSKNMFLHKAWISTMFGHNEFYPGHQSIQCLLQYYISPNVPNELQYLIIAGGGLLFLVMHYFNRVFELRNNDSETVQDTGLIMEWFTLTAILPNLVKTDSEHFLLSLPLIIIIIFYLSVNRRFLPIAGFIILIFFYGGNSTDLLGMKLSDQLFNMGMIGISNLLIISFALTVFYRDIRKWPFSGIPDQAIK